MKLRMILVSLILGFGGGVLFGSFTRDYLIWSTFCGLIAIAFILLFYISKRERIYFLTGLFIIGACLGLIRYSFVGDREARSFNCETSNEKCVGVIIRDPDRRDASTRLVIELKPKREKILAIVNNYTDYNYGDEVQIIGEIKDPQNFLTEEGKIFDYQKYLAARGINKIIFQPKVEILSQGKGFFLKEFLYKIKNDFLLSLRRALPEPAASLAGGLILGDKGGLGKEVEKDFRLAGVSHIVVLSGYNITVVAESVLSFFSWLSPSWSWLFGLGAIILFVLMVGGEAAIVRAAVMGIIALLARHYGRTYEAGVALIVAGFFMILWNPQLLAFDLGFQLSFLATLGLIYLSPLVEYFLDRVFKPVKNATSGEPKVVSRTGVTAGLKELVYTTTGAQLAVYPWLLYKTGNASLIGFISNIFILPIIPWAMLGSFLTGLTGLIFYPASLLISWPTYFLLSYVLTVANYFSRLL